MPESLTSLSQLAEAVGRSKSTVHSWVNHEEWPWSRAAPWDAGDAETMREWAEEVLRPDRAREANDRDGFYKLFGEFPPLRRLSPEGLSAVALIPLEKMPADVVSPWELEVISGERALTPAQAAEVVEDFARFRAYTAEMCRWLPDWLAGYDRQEIGRRLRSVVGCRLGWIQSAMQCVRERGEGKLGPRRRLPPPEPNRAAGADGPAHDGGGGGAGSQAGRERVPTRR